MPDFFVPFTDSPEEAERAYAAFVASSKGNQNAPRLYAVTFMDRGKPVTATVGQKLKGRLSNTGEVLAIIESANLVEVYGADRVSPPVMIGNHEVRHRTHFDDYPA